MATFQLHQSYTHKNGVMVQAIVRPLILSSPDSSIDGTKEHSLKDVKDILRNVSMLSE